MLCRLIVDYACESDGCVVMAECITQLLEKEERGAAGGDKVHAASATQGPVPHFMVSG